MSAETMRALIIGSGSIGQRHMRNLRTIDPRVQFVLLRRNALPLDAWPDAQVVDELEAALVLSPDLAVLATPSALHFDVLPALIAARIPTYVEKPMVTQQSEVDVIRAGLATHDDVPHVAGFNLRLLPSLARAAQLVADGGVGQIIRASFSAGQWLPDWRKGQDHRQGYSASRANGGGVLLDLCHEFDAARLLLGEMELLFAATSNVAALEIESEGVAVATARSKGGALVTINLDYVARQPLRRYEVIGTKGSLTWDLPARSLMLATPYGRSDLTNNAGDFDVGMTYIAAMKGFVMGSVSGGAGPLQNLEDGLRSTELAIRAHEKDVSQ